MGGISEIIIETMPCASDLAPGASCLTLWASCLGPSSNKGELSLIRVVLIPKLNC